MAAPLLAVGAAVVKKGVIKEVTTFLIEKVAYPSIGVVLFLIVMGIQLIGAGANEAQASASCSTAIGGLGGGGSYVPNAKPEVNISIVQIIYNVGKNKGASDNQIVAAVAVTMVETAPGPRNLASAKYPESSKYPNDGIAAGDGRSIGIYQQQVGGQGRDGKPWGTIQQIMDPSWAAGRFYDSVLAVDPNRTMDPVTLGYAVQKAADEADYKNKLRLRSGQAQALISRVASATTLGPTATTPTTVPSVTGVPAVSEWKTPLTGSPAITSNYGYRIHPITGESKLHEGVDHGVPVGTPVLAAHGGTVTRAGMSGSLTTGYGNLVEINVGKDAQGREIVNRYGHLNAFSVNQGDVVATGQQIALSGNTGGSTGAHLHFEVRVDNNSTDPVAFLASAGAVTGATGSAGANCSSVDGSLTDPGSGAQTADHNMLTPRAWNAEQVVKDKWGCATKKQQPCVLTIGGYDKDHGAPTSDHRTGNAIDVMIGDPGRFPDGATKAMGDEVAAFFQTNSANLGVSYLIWQGKIWSVAKADQGWRPYNGGGQYDPTSATGGHFDHVHVSVAK